MKKLLFLLIVPALTISAQDKLIQIDGKTLETKIVEVASTYIKYKLFSEINSPIYIVEKSKVSAIIRQNGSKEVFNTISKDKSNNNHNKNKFTLFVEGNLEYNGIRENYIGISVVPGITFNNRFFIGLGRGLFIEKYHNNYWQYKKKPNVVLPVFINTRLYFLKSKVSPLLDLNGGINIKTEELAYNDSVIDPFFEGGIGVSFQLKRKLGIYFIGAVHSQPYYGSDEWESSGILKLGLKF